MRVLRPFAASLALSLLFAITAFGQTNTNCSNAILLTNHITYQEGTAGVPSYPVNPSTDCNGVGLSHGVWFTISGPSHNTRFNLSTCGSLYTNSDGSTGNTDLQVYTNGCEALGNAIICSHGSNPSFGCPNFDAGVTLSAASNTVYYIFASGVNTASGVLNITATFVDPPTNDSCASPLTLTNGKPYVMITTNATEVGDPTSDCNGVGLSHGVWFTISGPSHNTRFNLTTCGSLYTNSDGSTGNTDLQVYTNGCGALGNAIICSHGSNPSFGCPNFDAGVTLSAPSNTIYYIFASGVNTGSGVLNITATFVDPPTNDSCASPITLTNGEPYVMITTNATEVGDPTSDCNGVGLSHGVWFTISGPSHNTRFNLSTCGSFYTNSDGSLGNTDLQVYTNGCGALGNAIVCSHGSNPSFGCPNFDAGVTLSAPSNTIYYIFASGVNTASGVLNITATFVDPPTNDSCASPLILTNGEPYVMVTTNATEVGDPTSDCNGVGLSHGVWFTINSPPHNTRFNLSTCGSFYTNSDGSLGNTDLQVYTNGCGALGNALICSHGSNPSFGCPNFDAGVTLSAPSNTIYYIFASGVNTGSGVLNITATFVDPPTNDSCASPLRLP